MKSPVDGNVPNSKNLHKVERERKKKVNSKGFRAQSAWMIVTDIEKLQRVAVRRV